MQFQQHRMSHPLHRHLSTMPSEPWYKSPRCRGTREKACCPCGHVCSRITHLRNHDCPGPLPSVVTGRWAHCYWLPQLWVSSCYCSPLPEALKLKINLLWFAALGSKLHTCQDTYRPSLRRRAQMILASQAEVTQLPILHVGHTLQSATTQTREQKGQRSWSYGMALRQWGVCETSSVGAYFRHSKYSKCMWWVS